MAASVDDTSWIQELENALLDETDVLSEQDIAKEKEIPDTLRGECWQHYLGIPEDAASLVNFNEIFDLPEQNILREDCQLLVDKLGNDEEDKVSVISDLESVITFFSKNKKQTYTRNNGWLEILGPLISLKLNRGQLYNAFCAIMEKYIPRDCNNNGVPFHLFRLLLLYHDPEICSFLDTKKIAPDIFALSWFRSLFTATCNLDVILLMWDIYFQEADPFLIFFLSLVMLVNCREQLLTMVESSRQDIIEVLTSAPCALESEDIEDFCSLAQYYCHKTPQSFRNNYFKLLFTNLKNSTTSEEESIVRQALCLPVSTEEIIVNTKSKAKSDKSETLQFFVVDCRPAEQYNSGHLPTAFHLDACLMLQEPQAFATAVQALFTAQKQAIAAGSLAGGEHLCFMGSGQENEDQYVHMVIASFLQKHCHNVSIVQGGYIALHHFVEANVSNSLAEHNSKLCFVCNNQVISQQNGGDITHMLHKGNSFIGMLSSVVRSKSAEVKGKLVDYITNPNQMPQPERHVSSKDKVGKRYRYAAPVFSIDDDHEIENNGENSSDNDDDTAQELISISTWLKKSDVLSWYKCEEINIKGSRFPSFILVTETHLFVLREIQGRKDFARITRRHPLTSIVKITSKKRHPELITFKYGNITDEAMNVISIDRFIIPQAVQATQTIKQQIMKCFGEQATS